VNTLAFAEYLKFARLQMAAEAFIKRGEEFVGTGDALAATLRNGNLHASRFTAADSQTLALHWVALDQEANTASGFSGTLFKCLVDDPRTGAKAGELVISFRSTEFIDDAARDNLATNTLEIKNTGFAWGQLADMDAWYARLRSEGKIAAGQKFSVTGYSLGGHLATAFNLMHPNAAQRVVTFNGAGVGKVKFATDDVLKLVQGFVDLKNSPDSIASRFSDAGLVVVYREISRQLAKPIWDGITDYQERLRLLDAARTTLGSYTLPVQDPTDPIALALKGEVAMIARALDEITSLVKEAERVGTLSSGGTEASRPLRVPDQDIGSEGLEYRMAVQLISQRSVSASLFQGAVQAFGAKAYLPPYGAMNPIGNQFDVVGDANPSMVAHSQWHIGQDVRIFIEDQPLYRGGVGAGLVDASLDYGDIKLLVDGYAKKDFGDTHSLVLLVDSLAIQNTLLRLLPEGARDLAAKSLGQILRNASNLRKEDGSLAAGDGQGRAEGDVLENVANALARMLLGPGATRLKGSPEGNTWATIDDGGGYTGRESLYTLLDAVQGSPAYNELLGLVQLNPEPPDAVAARSDFGVLLSLVYQTPFTLSTGRDVPGALQAADRDLYGKWLADSVLAAMPGGLAQANFSDEYLAARAAYVTRVMYYNDRNGRYDTSAGGSMPGDDQATLYDLQSPDTVWEDKSSTIKIQRGTVTASTQYVAFGGDLDDALQGGRRNDRLFGGGGSDSLGGGEGDDHMEGDAGDDTLDGGSGNDMLMGGKGTDQFRFSGAWGRDTIRDADGTGSISLDGEVLTGGRAAGANVWMSKTASGKVISYTVVEAASSRTGQQLVIRSETSAGNTITMDDFNRDLAAGDSGYLGLRLTGEARIVVTEGLGKNFFAQVDADPATLAGQSSDMTAGKLFNVSLNQVAAAGQTLQIVLGGALAAGTKAVLGDRVVAANGAAIELQEGQAQVSFALLAPDAINGSGTLQLVLTGQGNAVVSNAWGLNVQAAPSQYNVLQGDFTKLVSSSSGGFVFDAEGNYRVDAANPAAPGAADLILGTSQADRVSGEGGNDLLIGKAGNDRLEGGDGDDILQGGLGADTLEGGAGNDFIYGSSTGSFKFPTDPNWRLSPNIFPPVSTGFGWAVYSESGPDMDGRTNLSFSKEIQKDKQDGDQGNTIDAGAGDDLVAAGTGDDQVRGGAGSDDLYGMAGADVLLGEDGDDRIYGDGPALNLSGSSIIWAAPAQQGSDFIDGGDGRDILLGQGGSDTLYGGAGDDRIWGDDRDPVNTPLSVHGDDYLDGEDGDDTLIGGGRDDTLFGGAGNDILEGDDHSARLAGDAHGSDYIDGEAGDDTIFGGGASDTLFGGDGTDRILGDDSALDAAFDGDDLLDGEAGDDVLVGGGASDRLYGGGGNDRLFGDGESRETIDLTLSRHGDDYLDGGDGKDLLVGGGGSDTLLGGAGDDDIEGDGNGAGGKYEGNDAIDGGDGGDLLRGGGGADVILGGEGSDQIRGDAGNDDLQGGAGFDLLYGGSGSDRLQGGADDDQLHGGDGSDSLYGGAGNDLLVGGAGDDMLAGGDGDDHLEIGEGSDVAQGGAGNNTFLVKVGVGETLIESSSEIDLVKFETAVRLGALSGFAADGELVLDLSTEQRVRVRGNANFLIEGQVINGAVLAAILGAAGRPGPGAPAASPATSTTNLFDPVGLVVGSVVRSEGPTGAVTTTIYLGPDGSGPRLSSAWSRDDGSFGSEKYDLDGFVTGTRHNADGTYTQYETFSSGSYETTFSAQSVVLADAWTTTAGVFSGAHGTSTYNADGTYEAISYAPDGSYLTTTDYGDGNAREQSFDAAGNPVGGGRVAYADGTFALIENDGKGTITSTFFSAAGVRVGQQVRLPDGSHGATVFAANGASVSTLYRRDGTYSKSEDNGEGQTLTRTYAIGARLLGSTVTEVNGQTSITTFLDASGKKLRETWTRSDGSTGTDPVSASDYNGVANRIAPTFTRNPLRFQSWVAPDGAGGRSDHSTGTYGEDWWTGGDRPEFQGEFHVTTWSPTEIDAYYRLRANGPNFSTRYSMEVGYTSPALAQPFQNNTWKQAGYYLLFDFLTGATVIGRASTTGRKYLQINSGTLTEVGALSTAVHRTIVGSDGKFSVMDDDGLGNVSLTSFSSTGVRLGEMWFHNDGSAGADIHQADGTVEGVSSNADGTIDQYHTLAGGEVQLTSYPGAQSVISVATAHAPEIHSEPVLAASLPADLSAPPDSAYDYYPITISRGGDTYQALFDGAGNVEVSFDAGGGLSLSGFRVRTDPGYDSEVVVAGKRYDWSYDVRSVPTSRIVRDEDGSFQTFTLDGQGRVNGTSQATESPDGSTATLRYGVAGQFIGSSLEMRSGQGQALTREFDATGRFTASTVEVTDGHGNAVVSQYDGDGVLAEVRTRVVTAANETTVTVYDATGTATSIEITRVTPDGIIQTDMYSEAGERLSVVVAAFESDGSVTTSNYDGAGQLTGFVVARITPERDTTLATYDANGHKQREDVLHASGVHEYATYSFDSAMSRTVMQVDGSFQTIARDETGQSVSTWFSAAGVKLSDTWSRADGSTGSSAYNADGSWSAIGTYADGGRSTSIGDAAGTTTTTHLSATGVLLGTTVTRDAQGGFESTTFNATGVKTNAAWMHPDGGRAEYVYQPTGAFTGTVTRMDGSHDDLSGSTQGVVTIAHYNAAGDLFSTSVNHAPMATATTLATSEHVGQGFTLALPLGTFTDSDEGDILSYKASLSGSAYLPDWMTFDTESRTLAGTPTSGAIGSVAIEVTATDRDGASASKLLTIQVAGIRSTPISAQAAIEDRGWTFQVPSSVFSMQGEVGSVSYGASLSGGTPLPSWLTFDTDTRTFSGTPLNRDVGELAVSVTASDGYGGDAESSFSLAIANTNDSPEVWIPLDDQVVVMGAPFVLTIPGDALRDVDAADVLALSVGLADGAPLPSWMTFEAATRRLTGAPPIGEASALPLTVMATDSAGVSVVTGFTLSLTAGNHAPLLAQPLQDQQAEEGAEWTFSVPSTAFIDADAGDTLTYSARMADGSALPQWLTFDAETRTFSGTPGLQDLGVIEVNVSVMDGAADTVKDSFALTVVRAPNLTIAGTAGDDVLFGRAGDDAIDGLAGADAMSGGRGDDSYFVDNAGDVVIEDSAGGVDIVHARVTYSLGPNVENLVLDGGSDLGGIGNDLANQIQGNAGSNTLDGGAGADVLLGGPGNDAYLVDDARDLAVEDANEGVDTVYTSVTHTLSAQIENLVLTGESGIRGTGNELANRLQGNAAGNVLDGGAGADLMLGGGGDDSYVVDKINDVVIENPGEGTDTIYVGATYVLGANLENLVLTGPASVDAYGSSVDNALKGNGADNALVGGAGNDHLDGSGGADLLVGGAGDDIYDLNRGSGADLVVEWGGSANDVAQFGSGIAPDQLWFSRSGSNLSVQVIGTSDSMTMRNWYGSTTSILISFATQWITSTDSLTNWFTPSAHRIDWFKASDGRALQESQVQNLVNAMAAFSPPPAGQTTLSPQYQAALSATIAANWH
jgi:Ca2+-binding RTX toxin-like protein